MGRAVPTVGLLLTPKRKSRLDTRQWQSAAASTRRSGGTRGAEHPAPQTASVRLDIELTAGEQRLRLTSCPSQRQRTSSAVSASAGLRWSSMRTIRPSPSVKTLKISLWAARLPPYPLGGGDG
jgi:hypothetical protein